MKPTYIIAEAGVNHNGDFDLARAMVYEAKRAGADCVKFQTFRSEKLVSQYASKAEYQEKTTDRTETQLEMLQKLELSYDSFIQLNAYAKELGIAFVSTPFDLESIEFLSILNMPFWKIPSGEITNKPYLKKIALTKLPIVLSTGMSTLEEIAEALELFCDYSLSAITLLHCNTEYPTPFQDVNLRAMATLSKRFGVSVGYSDHTLGIEVPIAAVALGACVIEKHFTLDKTMKGPDHKASLEPGELAAMVKAIRNIQLSLGDGVKQPSASERKNMPIARKSIVAGRDIAQGERFTVDNITVKRPGDGLSPMRWDEILDSIAARSYKKDEKIDDR
jgi:N,N'-diacetyllegionaminate synthase